MNIRIIKTIQELDSLRDHWEKWQNHPNNDFDQFKLVCELRDEVEGPRVAVIEQENQARTLLIGRLEETHFSPPIGYFKPVKIPAKVLTVIHQGLLGDEDDHIAKGLIQHHRSLLASGEADAVVFYKLTEDSPLLKTLRMDSPKRWSEKRLDWNAHWQTVLPAEPGGLLKSMKSKHRSLIVKRQRNLELAFPGKVAWRWVSCFDDIPAFCAQLEALAARTYQRGLESGFMDNDEHRQRFEMFANRGQLRAQLLEIDGRVRAFDVGIIYNDTFFGSEVAYDPDLSEFTPGTLVMLRMIDELIKEGIRKVDWGLGDAHYKQQLGNHSWREASVWLFAPTWKGLILRSLLRLSAWVDHAARQVLKKFKLTDRVKTILRKRVAKDGMKADKKENDA